jgi:hypothetical protein
MKTTFHYKYTTILISVAALALLLSLFLLLGTSPVGSQRQFGLFPFQAAPSKSNAQGAALFSVPSLGMTSQQGKQCYVPNDETVVAWKGKYDQPCRMSFLNICFWPPQHRHSTYKVTVKEGTPLRNEEGQVIAATSQEERSDWLTYDSAAWNLLEYVPFERIQYPDYEPIAANEYVVMVETRYLLLHNVEKTLGICIQQP